ncbi:MAG: TIGR03435 family protein [Acidobacteriota bacterium]
MPRRILTLGLIAASGLLQAQATAEFEVATIKPAPLQAIGRTSTGMSSNTDTGSLVYSNVNLKEVIGKAYNVQQYQIEAPGWMETERFDIEAKYPAQSAPDQVPLMLQALLRVRFQLMIHRETKELPVYALTVAKSGPKVKTAEADGGISSNSNRETWNVAAKITMRRFAEFLTGPAGRPVVDHSDLKGSYDIALAWSTDNAPAKNTAAGPSLFTALQEQLGLKLESTKGPVEIVVVDHMDRQPSEN